VDSKKEKKFLLTVRTAFSGCIDSREGRGKEKDMTCFEWTAFLVRVKEWTGRRRVDRRFPPRRFSGPLALRKVSCPPQDSLRFGVL
jgi:hypothetical protein